MEPQRHLEIVRHEARLVSELPADALGAPVPTIDGWTVERVVRHLGKVHQWVTATLETGPDGSLVDPATLPGMPKGPDCLPAYAESVRVLLAVFEEQDPAERAVTFIGPGTVAWWARRQAHEVSVHRIDAHDAVHAAGGPEPAPLAPDGAADGIDEWARLFLAVRREQRFGALPDDLDGHTVHIHGTDDPAPPDGAEWLLTFAGGGVTVDGTHAKGDVALRGPAADLLLVLWRRRPLASVEVIGDEAVAERLLEVAQF